MTPLQLALNKFIQDNLEDNDSNTNNHTTANNTTPYASHIPIIMEVDYENRTQLFRLVIKKEWDSVSDRCTPHHLEANTWIVTKGFHGSLYFLPLHTACVLQPSVQAVHALFHSKPEGDKSTNQDG